MDVVAVDMDVVAVDMDVVAVVYGCSSCTIWM